MTERTFKLRAKVFAFCNGKENKTACILCEVRFLKKSRSSSFTNRILLDVMCSTEALLEVKTLPMQDMELQILCASASIGIQAKEKNVFKTDKYLPLFV